MLDLWRSIYHRLRFSLSRYPFFLCRWEQRTGGNPKLGMSENHSIETGVPPKTRFGGQGTTPRPDYEYTECIEPNGVFILVTQYRPQLASETDFHQHVGVLLVLERLVQPAATRARLQTAKFNY